MKSGDEMNCMQYRYSIYEIPIEECLLTADSKDSTMLTITGLHFALLFIPLKSIMKAVCPLENIN